MTQHNPDLSSLSFADAVVEALAYGLVNESTKRTAVDSLYQLLTEAGHRVTKKQIREELAAIG